MPVNLPRLGKIVHREKVKKSGCKEGGGGVGVGLVGVGIWFPLNSITCAASAAQRPSIPRR